VKSKRKSKRNQMPIANVGTVLYKMFLLLYDQASIARHVENAETLCPYCPGSTDRHLAQISHLNRSGQKARSNLKPMQQVDFIRYFTYMKSTGWYLTWQFPGTPGIGRYRQAIRPWST
jgi:hypothetical protein